MTNFMNQLDLQQRSTRYEQFSMWRPNVPFDPYWVQDFAWSYAMPMTRFDGFAVQRKAFVHNEPTPIGLMPNARIFETLATRNGVLLTVSSLNAMWQPNIVQQGVRACASSMMSTPCRQYLSWAAAVVSVHLTTFPIG
jgi:hypothetical protein